MEKVYLTAEIAEHAEKIPINCSSAISAVTNYDDSNQEKSRNGGMLRCFDPQCGSQISGPVDVATFYYISTSNKTNGEMGMPFTFSNRSGGCCDDEIRDKRFPC